MKVQTLITHGEYAFLRCQNSRMILRECHPMAVIFLRYCYCQKCLMFKAFLNTTCRDRQTAAPSQIDPRSLSNDDQLSMSAKKTSHTNLLLTSHPLLELLRTTRLLCRPFLQAIQYIVRRRFICASETIQAILRHGPRLRIAKSTESPWKYVSF